MMATRSSSGRSWDRRAAGYDAAMAGVERRFFAGSREWIGRRVRGATLEVAVGTGATFPYYPTGLDLTAVDASSAMLARARDRALRSGREVTLRRADACALPFPPGCFDTVVVTFALCCVDDERVALQEALRVLRPGGRLLLADHVVSTSWPLRALQHVVDLFSVPLQGEHYTRRPLSVLRTLGVTVVEAERLTRGAVERVYACTDG